VDAERRLWLESVAAACERALANGLRDPTEANAIAHRRAMAALLARIRTELDARAG
jgi:hypothetical protein